MKNWLILITPFVLISLLLTACGGIMPVKHGIGSTITSDKDGMTMVFVPQGEFTMGSDVNSNEKPIHKITLASYWIDQTEVTNAMYAKCVSAGACEELSDKSSFTHPNYYGNPEFDNYPVIQINWNMAKTYCEWRGDRLPTEAQWEKAARGTDARTYPWGNNSPTADLLNFNQNVGDIMQVGKYPSGVSPYGVYDMAGNVWECVSSLYKPYPYIFNDGREDLSISDSRVLRGGSWNSDDSKVRSANRYYLTPDFTYYYYIGFRCARSLP